MGWRDGGRELKLSESFCGMRELSGHGCRHIVKFPIYCELVLQEWESGRM